MINSIHLTPAVLADSPNYLQTIFNDMTQPHDMALHGVASSWFGNGPVSGTVTPWLNGDFSGFRYLVPRWVKLILCELHLSPGALLFGYHQGDPHWLSLSSELCTLGLLDHLVSSLKLCQKVCMHVYVCTPYLPTYHPTYVCMCTPPYSFLKQHLLVRCGVCDPCAGEPAMNQSASTQCTVHASTLEAWACTSSPRLSTDGSS